jgi:hypothetical protein
LRGVCFHGVAERIWTVTALVSLVSIPLHRQHAKVLVDAGPLAHPENRRAVVRIPGASTPETPLASDDVLETCWPVTLSLPAGTRLAVVDAGERERADKIRHGDAVPLRG